LPWGCETILSKIIFNLNHKNIKDIFFIANKNDESYLPHIIDHLKKFNIPRKNLIFINSTSGQAETVNVALKLYTNQKEQIRAKRKQYCTLYQIYLNLVLTQN
jgi:hypothetical protein